MEPYHRFNGATQFDKLLETPDSRKPFVAMFAEPAGNDNIREQMSDLATRTRPLAA